MGRSEIWRLQDDQVAQSGSSAADLVRHRMSTGAYETWFESDAGRMACIVSNGSRALLMVLTDKGDAGDHLVDLAAPEGTSAGYVLANGQIDTYPKRDTVELRVALSALSLLVDSGRLDDRLTWVSDR